MSEIGTGGGEANRFDGESDEELVRQYQAGNHSARDAIWGRYARSCTVLAREYRRSDVPLEKLLEAAQAGLYGAMEKFTPEVAGEVPFGNFAPFWIKHHLMKAAVEEGRGGTA